MAIPLLVVSMRYKHCSVFLSLLERDCSVWYVVFIILRSKTDFVSNIGVIIQNNWSCIRFRVRLRRLIHSCGIVLDITVQCIAPFHVKSNNLPLIDSFILSDLSKRPSYYVTRTKTTSLNIPYNK